MKRDILSGGQWGALLWCAALAPAAELLPGSALALTPRGGWLTPLAAAIILLPILWVTRKGQAGTLQKTAPGCVLLILCMVWMQVLLTLRLALCAKRMLWAGERDGAVWYFLLTLSALALWMGQGKTATFGRAAQIFLVMVMGAAVLVLGLSLPKVRADRILPVWSGDVVPVLRGGVRAAGDLCTVVLPALLLPTEERKRKTVLLWGAGGCVLLTLAQLIVLGNLGAGVAMRADSAFFALTKSVGIEGAFQRVESVVSALWMLSDLTLCVMLMQAVGLGGYGIVKRFGRETISSISLLGGTGAALWILRRGLPVEAWNRDWVGWGSLLFCLLAAVGLIVGGGTVKKTKQG